MPKPAAVREVEELEAADKWAKARMVGQEFDGTTFRDALDVVYWMRQVGGVESCGRRAGQAVVHLFSLLTHAPALRDVAASPAVNFL
jgi:hypothetical protein